jgi:excinuclease ABC subunit C
MEAGASALADAAEAADRGFVSELARSAERVFLPGRKDPVVLRQNSAELFLLARLRDEAHRFAITFHRKLRRERNFRSVLEEIPGIGEGRKKALLRHFGSLRRVREASPEQIGEVEGFGEKQARAVHEFFHREVPAGAPAQPGLAGADAELTPVAATEDEIDAALAAEPDPGEEPQVG